MKNTFFKANLLLLFMFISCKSICQIPIVWGDKDITLPDDYKSSGNYYYKDIPNYLNNFVGTWEYVNGNEKFQIILTKIIMFHQVDTDLNLNYYEDGIVLQYKKYQNSILTFESPMYQDPNFRSLDGIKLEGNVTDYGRVTKSVYSLPILGGGLLKQGGEFFYPECIIEKLPFVRYQPQKIIFKLFMRQSMFGETSNEAYDGLPTFSIPNNIEMVKI